MDELIPWPGFDTKAVHVGKSMEEWKISPCVPPIFMTASFKLDDTNIAESKPDFSYSRTGNPTRQSLEKCIAALEDSKYATVFSSGMSAITAVVELLKPGDHIVALNNCYGGMYRYLIHLAIPSGKEVSFVDGTCFTSITAAVKDNTKMVWLETVTNPNIQVIDIESIAKMVHDINADVLIVADNTFLSPYLQRPLNFGVDIVVHSVTKYMNGHSDVLMGVATYNNDILEDKFKFYCKCTGCVPSAFDCYLVNRSLATLELRMQKHMSNGLAVARFLDTHRMVGRVNHPGLETHPQYALAKRLMKGYSGIISFYVKGNYIETKQFLSNLKIFTVALSVGSYKSYASLPWEMSHASYPKEAKENVGITENLVRLSLGLEDPNDLIKDLDQGLLSIVKGRWEMSHASYPKEAKEYVGITENLVRLSLGLDDPNDLIKDLDQALLSIVKEKVTPQK